MKWCHGNVPVPVTRVRYRCKGEMCGCVQKMVGHSRIPSVPRVGDKETSDNLDTVQTRASQTSQAFVHGRRLGVIPSKCANGTIPVRCKVEEVVVLGTFVVEVVVLACSRVDGRGSRDLGGGSGTCFEEELDESE